MTAVNKFNFEFLNRFFFLYQCVHLWVVRYIYDLEYAMYKFEMQIVERNE